MGRPSHAHNDAGHGYGLDQAANKSPRHWPIRKRRDQSCNDIGHHAADRPDQGDGDKNSASQGERYFARAEGPDHGEEKASKSCGDQGSADHLQIDIVHWRSANGGGLRFANQVCHSTQLGLPRSKTACKPSFIRSAPYAPQ